LHENEVFGAKMKPQCLPFYFILFLNVILTFFKPDNI